VIPNEQPFSKGTFCGSSILGCDEPFKPPFIPRRGRSKPLTELVRWACGRVCGVHAAQVRVVIEICPGIRLKAQPVDAAKGFGRSQEADHYVRLLAARGLVGLATRLLRIVERAYRAGCLDVAQVEYLVRLSARLRAPARGLIGTKARSAPFPSAAGRTGSGRAPTAAGPKSRL